MPTQTGVLSADVLNAALAGLEAQRAKVDEQIEQVRSLLGIGTPRRGRPPKSAATETSSTESAAPGRKRRKFSAETRARMKAAQQKRWAEIKGPKQTATKAAGKAAAKSTKQAAAKTAPKKRRLSAAGRKRIIEATKKRWAEFKAKQASA